MQPITIASGSPGIGGVPLATELYMFHPDTRGSVDKHALEPRPEPALLAVTAAARSEGRRVSVGDPKWTVASCDQ